MTDLLRLVVIPSDPLESYEKQGLYFLREYFNPLGLFDEVYLFSPYEKINREAHGMVIRHVKERDLKRELKKISPSVVRAYGGYWASDYACYNRIPGVPIIVSVHDTNPKLLHKSVKSADIILCVSNAVAKLVENFGVERSRIKVIPNRIDTHVFFPSRDPDFTEKNRLHFPKGRKILHVGRKSEQKNLDTLIRALKHLPEDFFAVFVGAGDDRKYRELAKQLNVSHRCFWIEYIPNSELPKWYSNFDCFCTPSRWEGFGFVFIEAAACGAAIITSNIAPMNEFLVNDKNACMVDDFENPISLSNAILKVCYDLDYSQSIKQEATKLGLMFERSKIDVLEAELYRRALECRSFNQVPALEQLCYEIQVELFLILRLIKKRLWRLKCLGS